MLIKKPATDYWLVLAQLDTATSNCSKDAIARYYETLDESHLQLSGEPTRWRVQPPSVKDLTATLGRHGVTPEAVDQTFEQLSRNVDAACDLCRSCIVEVRNYGDFNGPVTPQWFSENLHEDIQMLLGQQILQRSMLTRADVGN